MADKKIGDLASATEVKDEDLLIMEQDGAAKNMSGAQLRGFLFSTLATNIDVVKSGNTITVTSTFDNSDPSTAVITLDDNDMPTKIVTDGAECALTWEGFT